MTDLVIHIAAFAAGVVAAWIWRGYLAGNALASVQANVASIGQRLAERTQELEQADAERGQLRDALRLESMGRATTEAIAGRVPALEQALAERDHRLDERSAELDTRLAEERKAAEEKLGLLDEVRSALVNAFNALSADALKSNDQAFLDLAKAQLGEFQKGPKQELEARHKAVDELMNPIRDSLQKVDGKLGDLERTRIAAYSALNEQLKALVETHLPMLRSETANLVKTLRQPAVRGRWGEIQLKRVVEMAGMVNHCDFVEQESRGKEDSRERPDVIVRLPGGKNIVLDAKAPIAAYLNALEAPDEAAQQACLADHARQVRDHMVALGRKGYWEQFDPTPEFVVLFLPSEAFFSAALQQDPSLIEFGVNERVIPATPTTLIALLRAVAYGWRQEALARNAQEVADLRRQFYERIATLVDHWSDVGCKLDKAVEAYNKSVGTLETRVLVGIEAIEPVERTARALQAPKLLLAVDP
jgi:DNA recombination protein RmuC